MAGTVVADTFKSSTTSPPAFQNTNGTAIGTLARAWVQFTGSTGSINASFNVSSVTRNGTGDYTVTFTNAMSDANYSKVLSGSATSGGLNYAFCSADVTGASVYSAPTASAFRFTTSNQAGTGYGDPSTASVAVFR